MVELAHELEHGIVGQMLQSELALRSVAGVGLAQHGMAVSGHDLTALQGVPDKLLQLLLRHIVADLVAQIGQPQQDLQENNQHRWSLGIKTS